MKTLHLILQLVISNNTAFFSSLLLSLFCLGCSHIPGTAIDGQGYSVNYDESQKITWYVPYDAIVQSNRIYLYFGVYDDPNKSPLLRFKINYYAEDWLLIKNCLFNVDDQIFNYKFDKQYREVYTPDIVFESSDLMVDYNSMAIINAVINGHNVKMRYEGDKGTEDLIIPANWRLEMSNVLSLYKKKGGAL